ncbi:hypothetical protein, partial [Dokdonella sp.]|uniref:hypothetical protein n=1 Tax=Dokdonella sp. TaxID=2291710 RepID=UPI002F3ECD5E
AEPGRKMVEDRFDVRAGRGALCGHERVRKWGKLRARKDTPQGAANPYAQARPSSRGNRAACACMPVPSARMTCAFMRAFSHPPMRDADDRCERGSYTRAEAQQRARVERRVASYRDVPV